MFQMRERIHASKVTPAVDTRPDTNGSKAGRGYERAASAASQAFEISKKPMTEHDLIHACREATHVIKDLTQAIKESHSYHETNELLRELTGKVNHMAKNQAELAVELNALRDQLKKIGDETGATLKTVADLEAALAAGGPLTQEVQDALAALKTQAQATDDLVPDVAAPTAPPA